jgi:hypothetical protein
MQQGGLSSQRGKLKVIEGTNETTEKWTKLKLPSGLGTSSRRRAGRRYDQAGEPKAALKSERPAEASATAKESPALGCRAFKPVRRDCGRNARQLPDPKNGRMSLMFQIAVPALRPGAFLWIG